MMAAAARAAPVAPALPLGVTVAMIALGDSAKWLHSNGSFEGIVATIKRGVPKDSLVDKTRPFQMNPRGTNPPISDESVNAVAAYIWKLNRP